jgi:hypothetical protein
MLFSADVNSRFVLFIDFHMIWEALKIFSLGVVYLTFGFVGPPVST